MNDPERNFIQNKIHNCGRDSSKMYKIINKLIGRNSRSDVSFNLVFNNIGIDEPSTIADYFNEHFVTTNYHKKAFHHLIILKNNL